VKKWQGSPSMKQTKEIEERSKTATHSYNGIAISLRTLMDVIYLLQTVKFNIISFLQSVTI